MDSEQKPEGQNVGSNSLLGRRVTIEEHGHQHYRTFTAEVLSLGATVELFKGTPFQVPALVLLCDGQVEAYPLKKELYWCTVTPTVAAASPAEEPNLNCKSVQKRLAAQWGFVPSTHAPVPVVAYTNEQIKALALANGFKIREQPNGSMDLNPYVYEFARALLAHQNTNQGESPR